jgi:DNA-binding Lrp family transcriptional regulator
MDWTPQSRLNEPNLDYRIFAAERAYRARGRRPSQDDLARAVGCSRTTVQRRLAELVQKGVVRRRRRYRSDGYRDRDDLIFLAVPTRGARGGTR